MRDHSTLIQDAGGPAKFAVALGHPDVTANNCKAWKRLNSIPAPYWTAVVAAGLASLEELAEAVAKATPNDLAKSNCDGLPQNAGVMSAA